VKVLIVGANGMLGQAVATQAGLAGINFESRNSQDLDISNAKQTNDAIARINPDYVINCAAYTQVDDAETNEVTAFKVNAYGAENLAQSCKSSGAVLVHISSDYVFDGKGSVPYRETDATNPTTLYGKSKLDGEQRIFKSGVNAYVLRTAWLYGNGGRNFVSTMIDLAEKNSQISVVNDQVGQPTSTQELARGIFSLLEAKPSFGIYNATSSGQTSWFNFAEYIFSVLDNSDVNVVPVGSDQFVRPAARPEYSVLSSEKWNASKLRPFLEWDVALAQYLNANYLAQT
jgi:dTDP-4-dehydrorhamnose reductase